MLSSKEASGGAVVTPNRGVTFSFPGESNIGAVLSACKATTFDAISLDAFT